MCLLIRIITMDFKDTEMAIDFIKKRINKIKNKTLLIIGISGPSCSGKTLVSKKLGYPVISLDDYYKGIDNMSNSNFDHPDAIDFDLVIKHLKNLKKNIEIDKPIYDFKTHKRKGSEKFIAKKVLILEGLFALHEFLTDFLDLKFFLDTKDSICFKRRIERDLKKRGRTRDAVIKRYIEHVRPCYEKYVLPTKKEAIVINIG